MKTVVVGRRVLRVGDVVMLLSGGQRMTVENYDEDFDIVRCVWFSGSDTAGWTLKDGDFSPDTLTIVVQ